MNTILAIVRWTFTLPIFALEHVFKAVTFIIVIFIIILMALLFPFIKNQWREIEDEEFYRYATVWKGNYPITRAVFELWS